MVGEEGWKEGLLGHVYDVMRVCGLDVVSGGEEEED